MSRKDIVQPRKLCRRTRDPFCFRLQNSEEGFVEQGPKALTADHKLLASEDLYICGSKLWLQSVV